MKKVISFLEDLQLNNNRDWFQKNKMRYDEAKQEMEAFVNAVIPEIALFDDSVRFVTAKECLFRIFRDVRFSKDKAPYKINMGAWITRSGRKSCGPGYYVHIQPEGSFLSGGVYMPDPDTLKNIRKEVYYNVEEFKAIMNGKSFKKYFTGLDDMDRAKLAPRDFPKDFPDVELLKNRHFTSSHPLTEKVIQSPGFPEYVIRVFQAMLPLNAFLGRGISG